MKRWWMVSHHRQHKTTPYKHGPGCSAWGNHGSHTIKEFLQRVGLCASFLRWTSSATKPYSFDEVTRFFEDTRDPGQRTNPAYD